jgi:Sap-like sulfolipid-1-addressing protein
VTVASTLPLAFVMIAGPQIISSFFFATSEKWKSDSVAYVLGAAVSMIAVVTAAYFIAKGIKTGHNHSGSQSHTIDYVIVALLLVAMVHTFLRRKQSKPPKWMGKLQTATPRFTFTLGFLLLGLFPSDLICSVVIGTHLANHGDPWWHALPFVFLTLLLLALPALLVLALGQRAETLLPKVRDWMGTNSWIVSEIVLAFFIVIVLSG